METGSTDTGSTDTGSTDTGSTETGSTDTGSTDTGSTDRKFPKSVKSKPVDVNSLFLVGDCPFLQLLPTGPNADGQP